MHARLTATFTILFLLALAGCGGGPDRDALRQDVTARLAQALPDGTVTLVAFERRGSQSDPKAPAGETRRIVYFDAELRLERDFDFSAWDAPGVAGIVSALGTGPKGITGITSGGNKTGDVLRAHGTALYRHDGDRWMPVASGGYQPVTAPAYATSAPQGAAAILDEMRRVVESVSKDTSPLHRHVIEQELAAANAAIRARLVRAESGYAIAAGPEHGQYLRFAQALTGDKGPHPVVPLITRGGEENLRMLREGRVSLALAQGDAALAAREGKGSFAGDGPHVALRAVGSLYPEPVHVLTRADNSLTSVAGLKGRRVAIGEQGAASRTTALRVLQAHGLSLRDIRPLELSLGDALVALQRKEVDAVIQVIGMPADSVRTALAQIPLRLVPLSGNAVSALVASGEGYFAYTIPRGVYAMQRQDVQTIATAALLLAGSDLSEAEIGEITRYVYGRSRDFAAHGSAQGAQVSPANARQGLSIPLHLAAEKALEGLR
ncbi:MAG: TAXI family TRAP transporter solute-binding subunit [Burkholderiales bacterium]|nr:TAXI family TRAP transporter solute-binding subunit [Burkholderiales bacterium]